MMLAEEWGQENEAMALRKSRELGSSMSEVSVVDLDRTEPLCSEFLASSEESVGELGFR